MFPRIAAVLACLAAMLGNASAAGHVYLLEGAFGVFSTGLVTLGKELRERGYDATVHPGEEAEFLASEAARLQKNGNGPIVIIGHSIGANAAASMAEAMKQKGASVALLVAFGPTFDMVVPSNVQRVITYYKSDGLVSATARQGSGFHGTISNVNLAGDSEINHFNIEKVEQLHSKVIAAVASVMGSRHGSVRRTDHRRPLRKSVIRYRVAQ